MHDERVTSIRQVQSGDEILFSTDQFVRFPEPTYDPDTAALLKRGPIPGTLRTGIVLATTAKGGVLIRMVSGSERKFWIPLSRVWMRTGQVYYGDDGYRMKG